MGAPRPRNVVLDAGALIGIERQDERMAALLEASDQRAVRFLIPAGVLCGLAGTRDIIDASVVVCARDHRCPVVTGDPDDLAVLDPSLTLHSL